MKRHLQEKLHDWMKLYVQDEGICNYAINYVLFLTTVREKYVKMYERFIEELNCILQQYDFYQKGIYPSLY